MDFTLLIIYKSEYNGIKRFIAFNGSTLLQTHRVFKSYIFTLYCPLSPLCQQSSQKNFFIPCTGYPIFVTEFTTSHTILIQKYKTIFNIVHRLCGEIIRLFQRNQLTTYKILKYLIPFV